LFENRMLRRKFGPKRDEVGGCRRKLHNEELRNFCSAPVIFSACSCIFLKEENRFSVPEENR
jgi:hypothetical protein